MTTNDEKRNVNRFLQKCRKNWSKPSTEWDRKQLQLIGTPLSVVQ